MAKLDNVQRIRAEDFPKEQQETVAIFAEILNSFMEQVYDEMNGNINFDNLERTMSIATVKVKVNSSGVPTGGASFKADINKATLGHVVKITNKTSGAFPSATPFVTFVPSGTNIYTITHITGLVANNEYEIKLLLIKE